MARLLALLVFLVGCTTLATCGNEGAQNRSRATSETSVRRLNRERVPAELQDLVPMAERWGIGDDVERNSKVDRATPTEREALRMAIEPHQAGITAWLDSFGKGQMSEEAAAFMYMQLALEEMRAGDPR
jgi:hypothetical protein